MQFDSSPPLPNVLHSQLLGLHPSPCRPRAAGAAASHSPARRGHPLLGHLGEPRCIVACGATRVHHAHKDEGTGRCRRRRETWMENRCGGPGSRLGERGPKRKALSCWTPCFLGVVGFESTILLLYLKNQGGPKTQVWVTDKLWQNG